MRLKSWATAVLLLVVPGMTGTAYSQTKTKVDAESLARVTHDITYLASDAMEGRGVETKGLAVAGDFIRDEFKEMGLKSGTEDGSYFQRFDVALAEQMDPAGSKLEVTLAGNKVSMEVVKDFQPLMAGGSGTANADVVFVGYGISAPDLEYDDYEGIDVTDKIVLMIRRTPQFGVDDSKFSAESARTHSFIDTKIRLAKKMGASGILFVNDGSTATDALSRPRQFGGGSRRFTIPFLHVARDQADKILAASPLKAGDAEFKTLKEAESHIDADLKPISQPLANCSALCVTQFKSKSVKAWNVVGVLEGEGPHANETVIVGAHYDHLGFGGYGSRRPRSTEVHNGADDNATGTAAVIELARRFAKSGKKPARRMVFIGFSGEERGLVGSRYYVDKPLFPLEDTVTMLNFDMIGNLRNNTANIGGTGTGSGLQEVAENATEGLPIEMDISPGTGGGSDHLPFVRKNVPVLFCNTGLTSLYHTPEDDTETLNMPGTVMVVDYCEALLKGVVGMPERPKFSQAPGAQRARVFLGVQTSLSQDEDAPGLLVGRVVPDSPAAKGGLKVGDLMQKAGDRQFRSQNSITRFLRSKKPGDKITISVLRDGEKVDIEVELVAP